MEILQFLLSSFLEQKNFKKFLPIFELLKENSFDIKTTVKNLNVQTVAPIIKEFINFNNNDNLHNEKDEKYYGTSPIIDIADKNIIWTLNRHFR